MVKKILFGIVLILLVPFVIGALWVNDSDQCPATHVDYPGQNCAPTEICGVTGGIVQCYDVDSLTAPGTVGSSNTVHSGSYDGGWLIDCFDYDGSSPHCDNSGAFWCNRDADCFGVNRNTNCTVSTFGEFICGECRTGYTFCDGSYTDGDGCEIQSGVTACSAGANNNVNANCDCVCDSNYYDCDASGNDTGNGCEVNAGVTDNATEANSNINSNCLTVCDSGYLDCDSDLGTGGTGCEVQDGGSCTVGSVSGTYSGCTCVTDPVHYITSTEAVYASNQTHPFFWGTDSGGGQLINFSNPFGIFTIDNFTNMEISGNVTADEITANIGCDNITGNSTDICAGAIDTNETTRVDTLEAANVTTNTRVDALEATNVTTNTKLTNLENNFTAQNTTNFLAFLLANGSNPLTANWNAGSFNITAEQLIGNLSWGNLTDYPVACPSGSAITQVDDTITCTDSWLDITGDETVTGAVNFTKNIQVGEDTLIVAPSGDRSILLSKDGGDSYLEMKSTDMSEGIIMHGGGVYDSGVIRDITGTGYTAGWDDGLHIFHDAPEPIMFSNNGEENFRINASGALCTNDTICKADLHIIGTPTLGSIMVSPAEISSNDDSEVVWTEDNDATYGMRWFYDGGINDFQLYGINNQLLKGPHIVVLRDTSQVGIGMTPTTRNLHINDTVRLLPRATAPSSPSQGDLYVDSSSNELCFYTGAAWVGLAAGGVCT